MLVTVRHLPRRLAASPAIRGTASAASFSRPLLSELAGNDIEQRPSSSSSSRPSRSASITSSRRAFSSSSLLRESYDHILVERRFPEKSSSNDVNGREQLQQQRGGVGIVTLHRPKALNALCDALFDDLIHAVKAFDNDKTIGCMVITGSGKAFAAGE